MFDWLKRLLGGSPNRTQERKSPPLLRMPAGDALDHTREHITVSNSPKITEKERVVEGSSGEWAETQAKAAEICPRDGMVFSTMPASSTFTEAVETIAEPIAGLRNDEIEGDPIGEKSWSSVELEGEKRYKIEVEPTHSTVCQKQLETDLKHLPVSTSQMQPEHIPSAVMFDAVPSWFQLIPSKVFFFDVETTGLHSTDRVVSFGDYHFEKAPYRYPAKMSEKIKKRGRTTWFC